jgi:hypothetical protein
MIVVIEQDDDAVLVWMVRTIEVSEWEHVVKTVFYVKYELEVWLSSKGSWRRNHASLVGS